MEAFRSIVCPPASGFERAIKNWAALSALAAPVDVPVYSCARAQRRMRRRVLISASVVCLTTLTEPVCLTTLTGLNF
jgi:hypothetical protein